MLCLLISTCDKNATPVTDTTNDTNSNSNESVIITILSNTVTEDLISDFELKAAKEYMVAHENITIEYIGCTIQDFPTKLAPMTTTGTLPNAFSCKATDRADFCEKGFAVALNTLMTDEQKASFFDICIKDASCGDELNFVPWDFDPVGSIYRSDIINSTNAQVPPSTWDEFMTCASAIKENNSGVYPYGMIW